MSKFEEWKEAREVLDEANIFFDKLKQVHAADLIVNIDNLKIETENSKADSPSFLRKKINENLKRNILRITQDAIDLIKMEFDDLAIQAVAEARSNLAEMGIKTIDERSPEYSLNTPESVDISEKVSKSTPIVHEKQEVKSPEVEPAEQAAAAVRKIGNHKVDIKDGQQFNHWTVISFAPDKSKVKHTFLCRCKCGTEKYINKYNLKEAISCGCHLGRKPRNLASEQPLQSIPVFTRRGTAPTKSNNEAPPEPIKKPVERRQAKKPQAAAAKPYKTITDTSISPVTRDAVEALDKEARPPATTRERIDALKEKRRLNEELGDML